MTESFTVDNAKYDGCAANIRKRQHAFSWVDRVEVSVEEVRAKRREIGYLEG